MAQAGFSLSSRRAPTQGKRLKFNALPHNRTLKVKALLVGILQGQIGRIPTTDRQYGIRPPEDR